MPTRKRAPRREEEKGWNRFMTFAIWIVEILVTVSVGLSMIGGNFTLPYWLGGSVTSVIVGWVIILVTLAGIITEIFRS